MTATQTPTRRPRPATLPAGSGWPFGRRARNDDERDYLAALNFAFDRTCELALGGHQTTVEPLVLQRYERERRLAVEFGLVADRPLPEMPKPIAAAVTPPMLPDPGPLARQAMVDAIVGGHAEQLPAIFGKWQADLAAREATNALIRASGAVGPNWGRLTWPSFAAECELAFEAARKPLIAAARAALEKVH